MRYVCYLEPDEYGRKTSIKITVETAIERQRAKHSYPSDDEALLDFLAENWAWVVEEDSVEPATLGCLLAQVREARGEPWYYPTALIEGGEVVWIIEKPGPVRQTRYSSEADCLLAALKETTWKSPKTLWTLFEEEGCE